MIWHISSPVTIPKSNADSEDERANTKSSAQQASINIFLNNGSIENWNLGVPEAPENVEAHSPSKSTLMAAAEEDLEERVSHALSGNPGVAALLLPKLKAKLSFILPLFCEEEECSPFEFSPGCSYFGYERGTTRKRTSGSTPSTASKSTSGTSITTPATSADSTKDCDGEEDDDELPNSEQPPQKRPRLLGDQDRRRLRCHFHAKSPNTHIQKTCIMSGWLNMHNLRFVIYCFVFFGFIQQYRLLTSSEAIMTVITRLFDATNASKVSRKRRRRTSIKELVLLMRHFPFSKSSTVTKRMSLMKSCPFFGRGDSKMKKMKKWKIGSSSIKLNLSKAICAPAMIYQIHGNWLNGIACGECCFHPLKLQFQAHVSQNVF